MGWAYDFQYTCPKCGTDFIDDLWAECGEKSFYVKCEECGTELFVQASATIDVEVYECS